MSTYKIGDMVLEYPEKEGQRFGMRLRTADEPNPGKKRDRIERPVIQCKIIGDKYPSNYLSGSSMLESDTSYRFRFDREEREEKDGKTVIRTVMKTENGIEAAAVNEFYSDGRYMTAYTEIVNNSDGEITLEMLASFAMYGISPYNDGPAPESYVLHRARSKWSREARFVEEPLEDQLLEDSWNVWHMRSLRFGQVGSMPVKDYFPFVAVEDRKNGLIWGVMMECQSSWQLEVFRDDDGVGVSGGIADREFGHWMKRLAPGESLTSNRAYISVCRGGLDDIADRLLDAQRDALNVPQSEESLPVIFNEYCTTWGNPSQENIFSILETIKNKGIDYFVVDCGWFKEEGISWDISMGDYIPSKALFPDGVENVAKKIRSYGMLPGIWFEPENIGRAAKAYELYTDHMLKRDGLTLTTKARRFWDMNDPWVRDYLRERVINFLRDKGFGYVKIDYNETIGLGCDNGDSLGEGLRQNMKALADFFKEMKRAIPDLVIENCASGGNRLEPGYMSLCSMASFSDAHECVEIPIIAAQLQRLILPRQSQIWCVIRKSDSLRRIAYSIAATFLGRMCLSGDVTDLSPEQWKMIDSGIAFYKEAAHVIKEGRSRLISHRGLSDRHPTGWQASVRTGVDGDVLVTAHSFANPPEYGEIDVPESVKIKSVYALDKDAVTLEENKLRIRLDEMSGYGVLLCR